MFIKLLGSLCNKQFPFPKTSFLNEDYLTTPSDGIPMEFAGIYRDLCKFYFSSDNVPFSLEASEWQKYVLTFQISNFTCLEHRFCWDATRKLKVFLIWNVRIQKIFFFLDQLLTVIFVGLNFNFDFILI
ncbi:unnamed protein product [Rhizophagus irregularis]|nr:unnamed protein product [Rhizophagus irregularis]